MNIVHINQHPGFGGQERQLYELVKQLLGKHNQTVIITKHGKLWDLCKDIKDIRIINFNFNRIYRFLSFLTLRRFKSVVDTKKFTIIHAHSKLDSKLAYALYKKFKRPYIVTFRNCDTYNYRRYIRRWRHASKLVPVSSFLKGLIKYFYPKYINTDAVKIAKYGRIIPDSYTIFKNNNENIDKLRHKYKDKFVVGCIARLDEIKGHNHIINVARRFLYVGLDNIHFVFVGTGPEEKRLREQAEGLPNIEFTGFKPNVGDYYSVFDICILFSVIEALGSCILEAFSYGLPVIASDAGGIPEDDKNLRQKIKENVKIFVKDYSIENQAKAYVEVYDEIKNDLAK
jgi:glycosyltransferase involved in cell wall biosynthesis